MWGVSDAVWEAASTLVENPFAQDPERWDRARRVIREEDERALIAGAIEGRAPADPVILAVGLVQAKEAGDDPDRVLDDVTFPDSLRGKTRHDRAAYVRAAMAAMRCTRALRRLHGRSLGMTSVRREVWAACFGDSLVHAMRLERVIRDHDVLILGETGTGKEAVAQAIQEGTFGPRDGTAAPRAAVNAAAVPETLIASELFGHLKGSFTGASESRIGRIRSAHGGSFFLDEIGDLGPKVQVKLLRVMETNLVQPIGSDTEHPVDVRYIAATHKDLEAMAEEGAYRYDLYQRIAGVVIRLPPLRERPEDIPEIGLAFMRQYLDDGDMEERIAEAERWLESPRSQSYAWPGNVRELQNALRSLILGMTPELSGGALETGSGEEGEALPPAIARCTATMQEASDWYMQRVIDHTGQNFAQTARILGIDRSTVRRRSRKIDGE